MFKKRRVPLSTKSASSIDEKYDEVQQNEKLENIRLLQSRREIIKGIGVEDAASGTSPGQAISTAQGLTKAFEGEKEEGQEGQEKHLAKWLSERLGQTEPTETLDDSRQAERKKLEESLYEVPAKIRAIGPVNLDELAARNPTWTAGLAEVDLSQEEKERAARELELALKKSQ